MKRDDALHPRAQQRSIEELAGLRKTILLVLSEVPPERRLEEVVRLVSHLVTSAREVNKDVESTLFEVELRRLLGLAETDR